MAPSIEFLAEDAPGYWEGAAIKPGGSLGRASLFRRLMEADPNMETDRCPMNVSNSRGRWPQIDGNARPTRARDARLCSVRALLHCGKE